MRNNYVVFIALLIVLTSSAVPARQLIETQTLTSNNIIALAGNGDTLWIATERGFNYRIGFLGDVWRGFEDKDLSHRFFGLAFGGGGAAAVVGSNLNRDQIGFWHFDHAFGRQQERYFWFSADMLENNSPPKPTGGTIYAHGSFWTPFGRGGMVRYDPSDNGVYAVKPGDDTERLPQNIRPEKIDGADTKTVLSLDVLQTWPESNGLILVTTPAAIWTYNPIDNDWAILHNGSTLSITEDDFISFNAAFVVPKDEAPPVLYSFMTVTPTNENNAAVMLYGFNDGVGEWFTALDRHGRFLAFPAACGSLYALSEGNFVSLYASIDDGMSGGDGRLSEIIDRDRFRQMLAKTGNDPNPNINDILFLPHTGNSGSLAVATTTGLYISKNVEPRRGADGHDDFTFTRYVREVGIGEAYALPGIMRASIDGRYDRSVFVYKLKNDGDVTIRVYDYNMSLVKTIIRGERRSSSAQRSTDPLRDFWDGTNRAGKRVWPGVYYFKITSTGGDRFIGRVVLAK